MRYCGTAVEYLKETSSQREKISQQVQAILLQVLSDHGVKLYLFGSWARGEERQFSDIDVGVWHDGTLDRKLLTEVRFLLEESTIPYRVDVVDLTQVDTEFLAKVKREGIVWND
jgi:hypothetical protein